MSTTRTGLRTGSDTDHCPDCGRLRYRAGGVFYHFKNKAVKCPEPAGE